MNKCRVCGVRIRTMCRMGTGICSENCEKEEKAEYAYISE